jgi:predicted dehydrogenase
MNSNEQYLTGENTMKLRLGIIGFGGIGHWHYVNSPRAGVETTAVYDIDPARIKMAQDKGLKTHSSLSGFLADDNVDLVLVATPNHVHKELVIASLRAGRHVMVEKPAALSVSDWDEMTAESKKAERLLTVHHNRRWDKDYLTMKKIVNDGCLGKVLSIESRVFGTGGALFGWRGFPEFGGGMIYDWGVHMFDQLLDMYSANKVVQVYAKLMTVLDQKVDDYFKVILTLDNGILLTVEVGTFAFHKLPRWYVIGNGGTLKIDEFDCSSGGYTKPKYTDTPVAPVVVMTPAGPTRMMAPRPPDTKEDLMLPTVETDWADLYKNIIAAIEGKEDLIIKTHQVRRVLVLIEAIFKASENARSLDVEI